MRWVCGTCVTIAIFTLAACSPYPADSSQFFCSGTCATKKQDVVYWCARGPTQVVIDLVEPGRAFKTCLADHGYVERQYAKGGDLSIEAATAKSQHAPLGKKPQRTKKTAKTGKTKRLANRRKSKINTQKRKDAAQAQQSGRSAPSPREFDPQDLFKNPSGDLSSIIDEKSQTDWNN